MNCLEHRLNGLLVRPNVGCKSAFVTHVGAVSLGFKHRLEVVKDLGTHLERLAKACSTYGHNHKFLKINGIVGMRPAI